MPTRRVSHLRPAQGNAFSGVGAAQGYLASTRVRLSKFPEETSLDAGAMIEPIAMAVHAMRLIGSVEGRSILVILAGPIGNLVAQVARGQGATRIMICDISEYRLEKARGSGLAGTVNPETASLAMRSGVGSDRTRRM